MKIAYLVGRYPNPSEQFIEREIAALRAAGVEVTVYPIECGPGFVCPWCALGRGIGLSVMPGTWRAMGRFAWAAMFGLRPKAWREFPGGLSIAHRIASAARAAGADRVHAAFATKPAAVGMMVAAMLRLPFTFAAHARDVFVDGVALRQKTAAAEWVTVCNRAVEAELWKRIPESLHRRVALVRHGLPLAEYAFRSDWQPHEPLRLLAAGRLVEKKGFGHLIEAMAQLRDAVCEIVGSGPLETALRRQIEQHGLAERVTLHPWVTPDELRRRMVEADLLVAPSVVAGDGDRDGVPNVLIEAAALGLPIVACDAGGVGEFVFNDETGRLVEPGDASRLAGAIRSAVVTPETTRRLAQAARKRVENEYHLCDNVQLLLDRFHRPGTQQT
jgi:glycosyltransferase involved in cell wall biosynthesis